MDCPICGSLVADARGLASHFRHQAGTHPDYEGWVADRRWEGKAEGVDYVRCLECGYRGGSLNKHLRVHGFTADAYRAKHGVGALLRPSKVDEKRSEALREAHQEKPKKGLTKTVPCSICGVPHDISAFASAFRVCQTCVDKAEDALWAGKSEPEDYVTCAECGYRADNLTAHIWGSHKGYRERHPNALVVALGSALRDKTALRGRTLSAETKSLMSQNAGRWNAGLTKETDERVAASAEKMRGRVSWNRGLTKETDPRIAEAVEKLRAYVGENRTWGNGLKAALTPEDFEPYLDEQGRVDRRAATEGLGPSWRTLFKWMGVLGLATSDKYVQERSEARVIHLDLDVLEGFKLGNGKVSIGAAMAGLGHSYQVISRECKRHGLETFHRRIRQTLCLDAVAKALGGASFVQEWNQRHFTNSKTGYMFKFDGYYKDWNLIVEFHGHQHWQFPNAYQLDESYRPLWEEGQWRDEEKVRLATGAGIRYLVVREDEPFTDPMYLAGRLVQMGVLQPHQAPQPPGDADVFTLFG
jgi:predicted transcriptional regulator